ncbi:cysteine desulfurase [Deferribacter autotrophicus]|uniref:Cysteine desulfurase n=1 Tax=Deferribacter autotrophicus TaxID=500465 RepID=A0A5A8F4Y9_9BACT|nr:cysteine desulfurase family protein [Deferribacter autotrophicus]KAA0258556.1 cysteine desulfurase [Deferribacter autotrophicus]
MIYLDFAATSPVYDKILVKVEDLYKNYFYNPSSKYSPAVQTQKFYDIQRERVAEILKVKKDSIIFTASATESNNLVLKGLNYKDRQKIVVWALEHKSITAQFETLKKLGAQIILINNKKGVLEEEDVLDVIDKDTKLVCIMGVNNETGALNPIERIAEQIKRYDKDILIMTDIVQAFSKVDINLENVDFATFSGHKIGGLRGCAGFYVKDKEKLHPVIEGGGHEFGIRSGTENIIGAYSLAEAARISREKYREKWDYLTELKEILVNFCKENRFLINSPEKSVPYIFNFSTGRLPSEVLINYLSGKGIYVSSGSACSRGKTSSVLKTMGLSDIIVNSSIRVSLHPDTKKEDIEHFCYMVKEGVEKLAL